MRTTLDIDKKLLDEVVEATGERTKSKAVNKIMEDYMRKIKIDELRAMLGKTELADIREEQKAADLRRQRFLKELRGEGA